MSATLATVHLMTHSPSFDQFRTTAYKQYGVKCNAHDQLIILSTVHAARKNLNNEYAQECNGLILERDTYRILCYPPRCLKSNHNSSTVGQHLKDGLYKVYAAELGTLVSLYFYAGEWRISTSNATDQRHKTWTPEGLTYDAMINECLETHGLTLDQFIAQLDPQLCYTVGFKHPDIHKFRHAEKKIWFVQKVCLDPQSPRYLFASDESPAAELPAQRVLQADQLTVRDLYFQSKVALANYLEDPTIEPMYGYILRGSPTQCADHSDLYVESSLSSTIRKLWYDNKVVQQVRRATLPYEAYVCVQQFLAKNETFIALFPQYVDLFTAMRDKLSALAIMLAADEAIVTVNLQTITLAKCKALAARNQPSPSTAADYYEFLHSSALLDDLSDYLWATAAH